MNYSHVLCQLCLDVPLAPFLVFWHDPESLSISSYHSSALVGHKLSSDHIVGKISVVITLGRRFDDRSFGVWFYELRSCWLICKLKYIISLNLFKDCFWVEPVYHPIPIKGTFYSTPFYLLWRAFRIQLIHATLTGSNISCLPTFMWPVLGVHSRINSVLE